MNGRKLPNTDRRFVRNGEVPAETVKSLEGMPESAAGQLAIKPLVVSERTGFLELHRIKGLIDPEHAHSDHESICYLVSGRMRVVIAGEEFIAEPGDTWIHPAGVRHYHETLEDSVQIEIKAPPKKTWA
ncbi:MAG TPA: cupin domain-containing protein [Alphaproteobacteria bacterium]|nr:cupin domain-containing protein [Alphaproteobacteria bacterium]